MTKKLLAPTGAGSGFGRREQYTTKNLEGYDEQDAASYNRCNGRQHPHQPGNPGDRYLQIRRRGFGPPQINRLDKMQ